MFNLYIKNNKKERLIMTKKEVKQQIKKEAIDILKSIIKKDDVLYTQLNHVSQSGMMRHISIKYIKDNKPMDITGYIAEANDWKEAKNRFGGYNGIKVSGCGMDMGFHVIYNISKTLFNDGYAIKQQWL
jgi:hypothetical protein